MHIGRIQNSFLFIAVFRLDSGYKSNKMSEDSIIDNVHKMVVLLIQ